MDYYISRNQKTYGPYSESEIRGHLESGAMSLSDYAWQEGESEWRLLGELMTSAAKAAPEDPGPPPRDVKLPDSTEPSQHASGGRHRGSFCRGRILAITLGIVLLVYTVSPYICLILLNRALGSGDLPMIEHLVDFPALRDGLHEEAAAKHEAYLGVAPEAIPTAVDYIERRYLTPSGLSSLLSRPELAMRERAAGTFASMTAQTIDPARLHWAFFTGPTEFVANLDCLKLTFRVSGSFWRLERINFL